MSINTWNFPCWMNRDRGPGATRGDVGGTFKVEGQSLPFSSAISGVFAFLIKSDYTYDDTIYQVIHSIGTRNSTNNAMRLAVRYDTSGTTPPTCNHVELWFWDETGGATRYRYRLGDEDGTRWLQPNKWYQVAFSATSSGLQYAVNGSTSPTVDVSVNTPGALNMAQGTERWWFGEGAYFNIEDPISWTGRWPSVIAGPMALDGSTLDLSDSAVLGRIFDADGNLKNPGANGSLWWNDAYTTAAGFKPDVYLRDGSPRIESGSASLTFVPDTGGGTGFSDAPGGLRKQYE